MRRKKESENRISPRKELHTRVFFEDEESVPFLYFPSKDISLSGIFVTSQVTLQPGGHVFLKFFLREGEPPIQVTGCVMRMMEPKRGRGRRKKKIGELGIGIRFIGLKAEDLAKIGEYILSPA